MSQRTVAIACDHAGFPMKSVLKAELENAGHTVVDLGTNSEDSVDYPDFGFAMAQARGNKDADTGVLVCGSGIGMSIAANKVHGVRAALACDATGAEMSRRHNDANVLCMSGDRNEPEQILAIADAFLAAEFEGGRHARRVDKIGEIETGHTLSAQEA